MVDTVSNPSSPETAKRAARTSFLDSLSIDARDRFLAALQAAKERGLDDEIAWREAVIAAETTYSPTRRPLDGTESTEPAEFRETP